MSTDVIQVITTIAGLKDEELKSGTITNKSEINLVEIINKINEAYHRDWERDRLEFAQNFLARTWAGIPLPVLSICGRGTQEIRYSKYLGYFFDGSKSHGLGNRYLDEVIRMITDETIDTYQAAVESEKWIGKIQGKSGLVDCTCDNVITCRDHVIFIEQKIHSSESVNLRSEDKQLTRYDKAIEANEEYQHKKHIKIYLTPTGRRTSDMGDWKEFSHINLVTAGLRVLSNGGISGVARENLKRFLLDLLIGPFNKSEDIIHQLIDLAKASVLSMNFSERLRFDSLVRDNEMLVKILMEG